MEKYMSIYLGIVVQNNDPEYRGRIKVWVPAVNGGVYDKWYPKDSALDKYKDRKFKFPGKNIDSDLSLIIEDLKNILPWAELCSPVVGESSSGLYNSYNGTATVSDSTFAFAVSGSPVTNTAPEYKLNNEGIGEKPGIVYEKYGNKLTDAFSDTKTANSNQVNQYGTQYRPSTYSNAAKGIFAVPNVGTHVWVFFKDGMPVYPLYFGVSFGADDFSSIFKNEEGYYQDYPQSYESEPYNNSQNTQVEEQIYRNKMVLNQRGAAIEIINTTDRESFKVTHFGGGFIELNNKYNSYFNPKNLQFLTLQDRFETVKGHNNLFTGRDFDNIIQGNSFIKIGNLNKTPFDEWIRAYTPIADILALPDSDSGKNSLAQTINNQAEALAAAEVKMGFGGSSIETITKHKLLAIGLVFNNFLSYRTLLGGKTVNNAVSVVAGGTSITTQAINKVDYTHIDDMPGGNYTVTAGNRYNLLVGSGGINLNTSGPLNINSTIAKFIGTQINLASKEDFNLDGGTNLSVIADIISIRSRNRNQTVVDDNLGVSKNVVIGGGTYTNGEVYLQHVTAPVEFQVTESTTIQDTGYTISGATITKSGGGTISSGNIVTITGGTLTINQPHTHYFKNLPLTLLATNADVRNTAASAVNGGSAAATATAVADHYNTAGGNKNSNPNGPINGVPG